MDILRFYRQTATSCFRFLLLCVLVFSSGQVPHASAHGEGREPPAPDALTTPHCGTISSETWSSSGNIHVVTCNVIVAADATLRITEGAIVRFNASTRLIVNGKLLVQGTAPAPVILTSYKDDGVNTCAPDDWDGVFFSPSSDDTSLIDHAVIRCSGWVNGFAAVNFDDASPTVQNTEFQKNAYCSMVADLHSFPTLSGNTYVNNFGSNQANGLCILPQAGEAIDINATWGQTDTSYFVRNHVTIALGKTLTINPGVVVKVGQDKRLTVNGKLLVQGTAPAPVVLTSYRDDEYGNGGTWDTDGGGASVCAPDQWDGIFFSPTSDDTSLINHAIIRCGGWVNGFGGVNLDDASPTIQNSEFRQNAYCSIVADLHSFPTLSTNTYTGNQANGLCILPQAGESIDINATWDQTDTSYFLRNHVTVVLGKTLIIKPGVVVKVGQDKRLTVNGKLLVQGTAPAPVILTSYRDDEYGNGTNWDTDASGASVCAPDQWDGIFFSSTSDPASLIDHALIRCGGWVNGLAGINFDDASPTIQNTTFRQNAYCAMNADLHSFPTLSGNTYINNGGNGLCILPQAGETIDINAAWSQTDTSYFVRNHVTVVLGKTWTISPGVVVKVAQDKRLTVNGKLLVQGTAPTPVVLTSYRDDEYGNGTNWDTDANGASMCVPDEWDGIFFSSTSDPASLIDHAIIRCGGWVNGYGGINFDHITSAGQTVHTVRNTKITKNAFAGLSTNTSSPSLINNCIESNPNYGLYNATPGSLVRAENQWWGSPSGPYHPGLNPSGTGNKVSDGVDFRPYLTTSACGSQPPATVLRLKSAGTPDGWVLETSESSNQGGTVNSTAATFLLGDNANNRQYRSILHFNTSSLPDNAVITKVILKIKRHSLTGTNPFATHGKIAVDIRKGAFSNNAALQSTDFQAAASKPGVGLIANNPQAGGWYVSTLKEIAYPYINRTGVTQLRLRFQLDDDNDAVADVLRFYSGNATIATDRPLLVIQYSVP